MPPKKPEAPKKDYFVEVMFYLLCAYIVWLFIQRIGYILEYLRIGSYNTIWGRILMFVVNNLWPFIRLAGLGVVILSAWGISYSLNKLKEIVTEEKELYSSKEKDKGPGGESVMKNMKWERVIEHINSPNNSEWKLAIIEADIMLDDLLRAAGYHGDSLGDMLKAVEKSDFLTIDFAWEAHKVRNQIAHQGADFELTEREAKRIIALYEAVFKEFKTI